MYIPLHNRVNLLYQIYHIDYPYRLAIHLIHLFCCIKYTIYVSLLYTDNLLYQIYHKYSTFTGWPDIGYSFIIGEDGNIYEGRGWNTIGAHTYNHNYDGLGMQLYLLVSFMFQIYCNTIDAIFNNYTIHSCTSIKNGVI